jgi:hypothetical protein
MRNTLVTTLSASMLVLAALVAMPRNAQSQVIIIVGNGSAQPYYPRHIHFRVRIRTRSHIHTQALVTAVDFTRGMATPHLITATTMATTAVVTGTPMATTVAITHPTDTSA